MNYDQTLHYLFDQLPMYQRTGAAAYKANLDNTLALDELFHHPHRNFKTIHVAGTNGKGSVSHWLASILQSAGYKVGLYTSPHLKDYRERIRINGAMIPKQAVTSFTERFFHLNKDKIEPSFFELSVMMAFDYFSNEMVDVAVIEVGLGGRLDSTNIITPEVSVITNISLDHTNLLGKTISAIAAEKAGIIKTNVPVVIGETQEESSEVFQKKSNEMGAPIEFADQNYSLISMDDQHFILSGNGFEIYRNVVLGLKGDYQHRNVITVVAAVQQLIRKGFNITTAAVLDGLENVISTTRLQGRWQQIGDQPKIVCDTGHNEAGIQWVVSQLMKEKFQNLHIVFGTVNDKDIQSILRLLPQSAIYYFTNANIERALDAKQLLSSAVNYGLNGEAYSTVQIAFETAKKRASKNDFIFVGGSTFVVAEII